MIKNWTEEWVHLIYRCPKCGKEIPYSYDSNSPHQVPNPVYFCTNCTELIPRKTKMIVHRKG